MKLINEDVTTFASRDGWFKSSYSSPSGACVMVKFTARGTLVGDSKDKDHSQPVLRFPRTVWPPFIDAISDRA